MAETAGTKLRRARTLRYLSLEDAARATKIRASQLSDLESDEYSNFANLAYARGFLTAYGKYLHVDVRPYLEVFADASTFGMDDYQYLNEVPLGIYRAPSRPWRKRRQQHSGREMLLLTAVAVVIAVTVFSAYLYVGYKRLGDLDTLADRQAARDSSGHSEPGGSTALGAGRNPAGPALIPVSSTPAPVIEIRAAQPVTPEVAPSKDDNRATVAALAVSSQSDSPSALLTQLNLPAIKSPGVGKSGAAADDLTLRLPEKGADPTFRASLPKPQKVANNSLE